MSAWVLSKSYDHGGREVRHDQLGEGPPMVLVHGTPWSSFNLRHLIRRLCTHYTVYFFDLLGYGQSCTAEGDVSLGVQNKVLSGLLAHWQLDDPIVIGHDFGGATVLRACLLDGCAFKKMVLIDPVSVSPWGSPFFRHVGRHQEAFSGLPDYMHEAVVRSYVRTAAFKPLDEETLQGIVLPWTGVQGKTAFYRQMAQADPRYTDEVQPLYPTITTPTLILWGREDNWIPLARGQELQRMIPGSELRVIDNAGHLVIEERPDALAQEILQFAQAQVR